MEKNTRAAKAPQDPWRISRRGDPYLIRAGLTLTVYPRGGGYVWRATGWDSKASVEADQPFLTIEHAKAAGLAALPESRRRLQRGRRP